MSTPTELKLVPSPSRKSRRTCLLVLGMHRSGTSAIARAINLLGPDMPRNLLGAEAFNRAGHWEPERIVAVNDELLERAGSRWDDWRELDLGELSSRERTRYEDWLRALIDEEFDGSDLFVLKDPRICRLVPFYRELLNFYRTDAVCVLPFRNPIEVCQSLARRDNMTTAYASLVWLRHVLDAEFYSRASERSFVNYHSLLADPVETLRHVERDLDIEFPNDIDESCGELEASLRGDLQHHEASFSDLRTNGEVSEWVKSTYACLLQLESDPQHADAMAMLDHVRTAFNEAARVLGAASFGEFARREESYRAETHRLSDAIRAHEAEITRLEVRHQEFVRSFADLKQRFDQSTRHAETLATTSERLSRELEAVRQARAETEAALGAEAAAARAAAAQELHRMKELATHWETRFVQSHNAHSKDLAALTASTSWRITRPLRGLKRALAEPGFLRAVMRGAARRILFVLPLPRQYKTDIATRYHQWRLRNSVPTPALAAPVAAPPPQETRGTDGSADAGNSGAGQLPFIIPTDGRWNLGAFEAASPALTAYMAALSRGYEEGPLWQSDLDLPSAASGPLVSLIVRTYKGRGSLLEIALASIAAQSYRPIEVLVMEDGGRDLRDIVERFSDVEGISFRHIECPKLGRSNSANAGLEAATGEYVGFLDDDDYLLPDHVATLSGCLQSRSDLAAVYSAALELGADLDPVAGIYRNETKNAVFFHPLAVSSNLVHRNLFPIQSVLFRAGICTPDERFDVRLDALEDWLFWLRLLTGHQIAGLPAITSAFYVPAAKQNHKKRIDAHIAAEPYFTQQRRAFFESRRLTSLEPIREDHAARHRHAAARSQLAPRLGERPEPADAASPLLQVLGGDPAPALVPRFEKRIAAYTSINLRYLPKALAWAKSVKKHNPDWETHILLNDAVPVGAENWPCVDIVYPIGQLGVPNFQSWAFRMRVVELCTATKPFYARKLLEAGYDHVFYFDPDTFAYSDLNQIVDTFGDDEVLITPHCAEDATSESEIHYNEMSSLAHGVFNLGFLGLRNTENARKVIDFWCRRLLRHCEDDHGRGLFTDQKWFNLVPVFFDRVKVLKHKGCNTASWNIAHRPVSKEGDRVLAGGENLIFFHFSGYDRNTPRAMFDIFGQFNSTLKELIDEYDRINDQFAQRFPVWKSDWALSKYWNDRKLEDAHRELYRTHYEYQLVYETPFETGPHSFYELLSKLGDETVRQRTTPRGFIKRHF